MILIVCVDRYVTKTTKQSAEISAISRGKIFEFLKIR